MNTDQIVPGRFKCAKCGFQLITSILYAQSGNIGPKISNMVERCPNDNEIMAGLTWKELAEDVAAVCENQVRRAVKAEEALRAIKLHCLTTKDQWPLSRVVRICIDAGIKEKLNATNDGLESPNV